MLSTYFRIVAAALFCLGFEAQAAERLPAMGADLSQTSVSGVSSGAAMAVQFHVAHSSIIKGAGVIAGVPYDCAQQSTNRATKNCMKPDADNPAPDPEHLTAIADELARAGAIDDVAKIEKARVWLFSGRNDTVVFPGRHAGVRDFYAYYVPPDQILFRSDVNAGHAMITEDYGAACDLNEAPYIGDCDLDAAKALLGHIYGPTRPAGQYTDGMIIEFDQKEFLSDASAYNHSMADSGFVYVPKACAMETCRVHVALHGCSQQAAESATPSTAMQAIIAGPMRTGSSFSIRRRSAAGAGAGRSIRSISSGTPSPAGTGGVTTASNITRRRARSSRQSAQWWIAGRAALIAAALN